MAALFIALFWIAVFGGVILTLAYRRVDLKSSTMAIAATVLVYSLFGNAHVLWLLVLWLLTGGLVVLNFTELRRSRITAPLFNVYKTMVPTMSDTEREALEAGTVWWDGELFTGLPDWSKIMSAPAPALTPEEKAFLDGPVAELCGMLDEWQITHELADMPEHVWQFIKDNRFFAMIIPREYGGLEFSPYANAQVLAKIASCSTVAASTIGVPNSLGPAELLLHYGTDEQKQRYLPGLASGDEIPCFALTAPRAGSDASAIPDTGVVCRGTYNGEEVIGIRLNFAKRYITLAPVATVLGLAFKLYDPDHLIGDRDSYGITAALIPADTPGVEIGRRHMPLNIPFQNGPIKGKDVFVPLDSIIGGQERAGQGWKMLVELLSVGRGITLPSNAMGGGRTAVFASGAYARIRQQFGLPIAKFEGVGEALARIAGMTYIINSAVAVTTAAIGRGEKPAVPSAILKYHCTEFGRAIANDAMDVHGGKGIMLGPRNYLGRGYQAVPIAITVEGANILTRNLIIFGQGAVRCHPFVLEEMRAASDPDPQRGLATFDESLFNHMGFAVSNAARSFCLAMTHARMTEVPAEGPTARYYQHINRYSAAFALAADVAMLTLGGDLKRKESLSARLGDVFSAIYLASMVLKHYRDEGEPESDLPLVEWSCRYLLYHAQEQLHGFLRNFPIRPVAALLRALVFPRGRTYFSPADAMGADVVRLITAPTDTRRRLCAGIHAPLDGDSQLSLLRQALKLAEDLAPLEAKIRQAVRTGVIGAEDVRGQLVEAVEQDVLTDDEAAELMRLDDLVMSIVAVDDFAHEDLARPARKPAARKKKKATTKKAAKRKTRAAGTGTRKKKTTRKPPRSTAGSKTAPAEDTPPA